MNRCDLILLIYKLHEQLNLSCGNWVRATWGGSSSWGYVITVWFLEFNTSYICIGSFSKVTKFSSDRCIGLGGYYMFSIALFHGYTDVVKVWEIIQIHLPTFISIIYISQIWGRHGNFWDKQEKRKNLIWPSSQSFHPSLAWFIALGLLKFIARHVYWDKEDTWKYFLHQE